MKKKNDIFKQIQQEEARREQLIGMLDAISKATYAVLWSPIAISLLDVADRKYIEAIFNHINSLMTRYSNPEGDDE